MTQERKALLFPGQGLPPQDIIDCYHRLQTLDPIKVSKRIATAQKAINRLLGTASFSIAATLEDKDSPNFSMTSFVQPVVYTLSILTSEIAETKEHTRIDLSIVAGHSLGEYSALTQAKVLPFSKGIEIVTFRGNVMQEASEENLSLLISINGLDEEQVKEFSQQNGAEIALINAPTLIIVGVSKEGVVDIEKLAKEAGARRVTILPTAGAFHTHFMQTAATKLDEFLSKYDFSDPKVPVVPNLTGQPSNSGRALKNHLVESMTNPVRWTKSIQTMRNVGIQLFVECGPGKSLATLNRINGIPEDQTINILDQLPQTA